MVEYGNGIGQSTGIAGGGGGGGSGGGSMDAGAALGQAVGDFWNTVTSLPPEMLLLSFVVIVVGFIVLKRAF